ncbi:MAG TPA: hypothetical protein VHB73_00045, partial [Alphaproteobacteria bacterium]|nr:hypothetical protein [Alphaproteobacteria bacterium]
AFLLAAGFMASPAHAEGKAPAHKAQSHMSTTGQLFYITMNPMILPIVTDTGIQEVVSVVVALEVKDEETMQKVNNMVPKLGDAYMRSLYGKIGSADYRNGRFLDLGKLKNKLSQVTENVLGKGLVQDVLIEGVNQRHYD